MRPGSTRHPRRFSRHRADLQAHCSWTGALVRGGGGVFATWGWRNILAEAAHSSGPFLFSGSLLSPLRQPDSTVVAMSIFLLLTSLTYLLFKLSPRSDPRTVHVAVCACQCVW